MSGYSLCCVQGSSVSLTCICSHLQVCEAVVASGESLAKRRNFTAKSPLMYEWYQEYYVGAAHGLAGIYYYLMQVRSTGGEGPLAAVSHFFEQGGAFYAILFCSVLLYYLNWLLVMSSWARSLTLLFDHASPLLKVFSKENLPPPWRMVEEWYNARHISLPFSMENGNFT